ncbi:unnamed protein product [Caenorhabditis brenneri]
MTNAHSFPLLRLPLLAAIKGIHLMNVREQFKLSKLSKRSLFIVKNSVKKQCYQLQLDFRKEFPVTINNLTAKNEYRFNLLPFDKYPDVESIKQLLVQVAAVFSNLSIHLDCSKAPHPRYLMDLVPLTKNLNLKRGLLVISTDEPDDKLCRFIFKECNDFKQLRIYCKTSTDFEISPERIGSFRTDHFEIHDSWFTINHVLHSFMNCKKLDLSSLNFTVTKVNAFLQNWIQGSGVHFLRCKISEDEVNMEALLQGMTAVLKPVGMIRFDGSRISRHHKCFIIQQSNGVKGVVCVLERKHFYLSTVFELENGEKYGNHEEEVRCWTEVDDESFDRPPPGFIYRVLK